VFTKSILSLERAGTWAAFLGLRWQIVAATALWDAIQPGLVLFQNGVALRLPPQSKIFHLEAAPWKLSAISVLRQCFLNRT
jgi:hypothetical protein